MTAVNGAKRVTRRRRRWSAINTSKELVSTKINYLAPAVVRRIISTSATSRFCNDKGEFLPTSLRVVPTRPHGITRRVWPLSNMDNAVMPNRYNKYFETLFLQRYFFYVTADPSKVVTIFTHNRSSFLPRLFRYKIGRVYRGRGWKTIKISAWRCGFRLGEFARSRKRAVFRAKTMKKKAKSRRIAAIHELKIKKIKTLKSGKSKKNRLISRSGEVYL